MKCSSHRSCLSKSFLSSLQSARAVWVEISTEPWSEYQQGETHCINAVGSIYSIAILSVYSTDPSTAYLSCVRATLLLRTYLLACCVILKEKATRIFIKYVCSFKLLFLYFFFLCSSCRLSMSTSFMSPRTHHGSNCLETVAISNSTIPCRFHTHTTQNYVRLPVQPCLS